MIHIDGSQGEGGGQILRSAISLSMITGQAAHITHIRAGREKPGLAPQHVAGILAARSLCDAEVSGAEVHSTQVRFSPGGPIRPGAYLFDVSQLSGRGSAGAITLILQAIALPLALADGPSTITLRGGTHVRGGPPFYYFEKVLLPTLAQMGIVMQARLNTYGWYPVGLGEAMIEIAGRAQPQGLDLTQRPDLSGVEGLAVVSNLPSHIPQRISARANNLLKEAGLPARVQALRAGGPSTGAGIFLAARYGEVRAGFSGLGRRGLPSDEVAEMAVEPLIEYASQPMSLDPYLPDQLLVALALARGTSALTTQRISLHTLTNRAVIGQFVERRIIIEGVEGQPGRIEIV
jgi:RNA 3'-terminal phosphate cyclase (ATP)